MGMPGDLDRKLALDVFLANSSSPFSLPVCYDYPHVKVTGTPIRS